MDAIRSQQIGSVTMEVHDLPSGDRSTTKTLDYMAQLIKKGKTNQDIIYTARRIAMQAPERDQVKQIEAIHDWVKQHMYYINDPDKYEAIAGANGIKIANKEGIEILADPVWMLNEIKKNGQVAGDCDEFTILEGSLLGAIGFPVYLQAIGTQEHGNRYGHVYLYTYTNKGQRIALDPIMKSKPAGWEVPERLIKKKYVKALGGVMSNQLDAFYSEGIGDYELNEKGQVEIPQWTESNYLTEPDLKNVVIEHSDQQSTKVAESPKKVTKKPATGIVPNINNPFLEYFGIKEPVAPISPTKVADIEAVVKAMQSGSSGLGAWSWFSPTWAKDIKKANLQRSVVQSISKPAPAQPTLQQGLQQAIQQVIPKVAPKPTSKPAPKHGLTYDNFMNTLGLSGLDSGLGDGGFDVGATINTALNTISNIFGQKSSSQPAPQPQTVVVQQPTSSSNTMKYVLLGGAGLVAIGILAFLLKPTPVYHEK